MDGFFRFKPQQEIISLGITVTDLRCLDRGSDSEDGVESMLSETERNNEDRSD